MLRDKNLVPLSHQHQHALALCVRIDRAQPIAESDLETWQAEIEQHFEAEIEIHFQAEESLVFPAACQFPELTSLAEELIAEHVILRESFSDVRARRMTPASLPAFAQRLSDHIRKEERRLFAGLQRLMTASEMAALGKQLEAALKDAVQACMLTSGITALRPKQN